MSHSTHYGTKERDFDALKSNISNIFGVDMQERKDSKGGKFALGGDENFDSVRLYRNPSYLEGTSYEDECNYYILEIICKNEFVEFGYVNAKDIGFKAISYVEAKDI